MDTVCASSTHAMLIPSMDLILCSFLCNPLNKKSEPFTLFMIDLSVTWKSVSSYFLIKSESNW
uniref:Phage terminase, large subunit n=1 Tax=uncultured marine virus TaxID=186617 RepID=A0A0F7L4W5_9VIRU|nr:phage terminase, large subunit [uncultured marine virus]